MGAGGCGGADADAQYCMRVVRALLIGPLRANLGHWPALTSSPIADLAKRRGKFRGARSRADLQGREGLFAGRAAQDDRARAKSAAAAIGGSLDREATARDAAVRHHTGEVEQQRARDAVEVPGLSKAALDAFKAVQMAGLTAEIPREGERYDARQRRREELVSAAWREGRADPRVANELDGFMAAASQRLGEEGMRNASRAASSGRSMTVPCVGREHQAGLDRAGP